MTMVSLDMCRRERRPDRASGVVWLAVGAVLLALGCSPPARAVAPGPPTSIALDVGFFLPVLGTWVVRGSRKRCATKLAKYDIAVVDRRDSPANVAVITLGAWSDRVGGGSPHPDRHARRRRTAERRSRAGPGSVDDDPRRRRAGHRVHHRPFEIRGAPLNPSRVARPPPR